MNPKCILFFLMRTLTCLVHLQALYDDFLRSGLLELQKFHEYERTEIMKMLEEESSQLSAIVAEIQEKLSKICISIEISENPVNKLQCCDSSCKDVHVNTDVGPNTSKSPKVCFSKQFMLSISARRLQNFFWKALINFVSIIKNSFNKHLFNYSYVNSNLFLYVP
jgi:hypothetical protein